MAAQPLPERPSLTVIEGGRPRLDTITVRRCDWDELRAELRASIDERRAFASEALALSRRSQVLLASGRSPASLLDELERAAVREGMRLLSAGVDDGPVPPIWH